MNGLNKSVSAVIELIIIIKNANKVPLFELFVLKHIVNCINAKQSIDVKINKNKTNIHDTPICLLLT